MDKFITRGLKHTAALSDNGPSKKKVIRQYDESYLAYGFTCSNSESGPQPQCLLCCKTLSNANLVPSKLKRHLDTAHPLQCKKPVDYFQRLVKEKQQQGKKMSAIATIPKQALEASFLVSLRIAKAKKPHTIAEDLLLPAAIDMCRLMIGDNEASRLKTIPLSNDTVARRISDLAEDIEAQLFERLKIAEKYALQLDESTDISNKAQLLVYIRYVWEGNLEEEMLFCKSLAGYTTAAAIFEMVNATITCDYSGWCLGWDNCLGVCTDGAPAMAGVQGGVVTKIKEKSPAILITHCIIHREHLAAKKLNPSLNEVLLTAVKIVNFIKSRPLQSRLFTAFCIEMGAEHQQLLLHTEVRWLSRGKVLTRLYELRVETKLFLEQHDKEQRFHPYITSLDWIARLAYLSDIYEKVNVLNLSLQGPDSNIIHSSSKINGFILKLALWKTAITSGKPDFFDNFQDFLQSSGYSIENIKEDICEHLSGLEMGFGKYFQNDKRVDNFQWIANPFTCNSAPSLPPHVQESLIDLSMDPTLKAEFQNVSLSQFWIRRKN